jgi:(5-formylfuran-3-yl)methyl phosphate synthase
MISVVSAMEAREAISGGAEILDIKNPAEGSLGAQPPFVIREIKGISAGKTEISAAIGDMPNLPGTAALAALGAAASGADYVKVGLFGPRNEAEAVRLLREVQQSVCELRTSIIAAAYADFERASTLNPAYLPGMAAKAGVKGCLLDTAVKDGHTLFDYINSQAVRALVEQAHAAGLLFGIAGALRERDLLLARDLGVDVVGIRTAACRNSERAGPLEAARVRQLHRILVPAV